jgi:hypothetical protein
MMRWLRTTCSARSAALFVNRSSRPASRLSRPAFIRLSISPTAARDTPSMSATRAALAGDPAAGWYSPIGDKRK